MQRISVRAGDLGILDPHAFQIERIRLVRSLAIVLGLSMAVLLVLVGVLGIADVVSGLAATAIAGFGVLGLLLATIVFYVSRLKRHVAAGRVLFYGLLVLFSAAILVVGGVNGPMVVCITIPVVASGLIGRNRDSLYVSGLAVAMYLGCLALQSAGVRPLISPELLVNRETLFNSISVLIVLAILTAITWISARNLNEITSQVQAQSHDLMTSNERLIEKNIQQVTLGSELSAAASQLLAASQQQASGATQQASAVSEVSTTIEELGSTARQIALASEQVASAAQNTLESLSSGQAAVDESIQAMERIRGRVQDVSVRVLGLGERSQQIGEIIDLIDDIADETHLLSLNAAIEAAGAGEHGRRFAVVAAEVKSLANRVLAAAREVKGVIAQIQQATNAAVLAAEEGGKEVERGVILAHRAGEVMDSLVMMAERTAQSAAEISLATAQQQSASEQVVETMREIAEVSRQTASGSRQMAESAAMLTRIAERLHGMAIETR